MSEQSDDVHEDDEEFSVSPPMISLLWDLKHARTVYEELDALDSADLMSRAETPALHAVYRQLIKVRDLFKPGT